MSDGFTCDMFLCGKETATINAATNKDYDLVYDAADANKQTLDFNTFVTTWFTWDVSNSDAGCLTMTP